LHPGSALPALSDSQTGAFACWFGRLAQTIFVRRLQTFNERNYVSMKLKRTKVRDGGKPPPAREARALPGQIHVSDHDQIISFPMELYYAEVEMPFQVHPDPLPSESDLKPRGFR
jgi:hypothetical protein